MAEGRLVIYITGVINQQSKTYICTITVIGLKLSFGVI